jgi:hypothetical protein
VRETFREAAGSRYFRKLDKDILLENRADVWGGEKIITVVKKYKTT